MIWDCRRGSAMYAQVRGKYSMYLVDGYTEAENAGRLTSLQTVAL